MTTNAVIVGNLTRNPDLNYTETGTPYARFSVAVGSRRKNAAGDWENGPASFYEVVCWRRLAEGVADLVKGQRVIVYGQLRQHTWQTADRETRSKVEIIADAVGPDLTFAKPAERRVPSTAEATP